MSYNKLIKLTIIDLTLSVSISRILILLAVASAWVNSQFALAVLLLGFALSFDRIPFILHLYKVSKNKLSVSIFSDGQVRLESLDKGIIAGFLGAQQWCSSHFAVLQVLVDDKTRHIVVLSAQQKGPDDYRRLKMWLRQDFCRDTRAIR